MAVVAHHPVVVQLERVAVGLFSVDEDFPVLHFQVVAFIHLDGPFVDSDVVHAELEAFTFLGNPHRSVVVARPSGVGIARISLTYAGCRHRLNALHVVLVVEQSFFGSFCQRHAALLREVSDLLNADAQLLEQLVGQVLLQLHGVGILHVVGLFVRFAVQIDDVILDLQRLSGQAHAALHVVFAPVGGS